VPQLTIPAEAGMNRYGWDLRYEPPVKIPGAFYGGLGPQGPLAVPGAYQVKLTAGSFTQTVPLELRMDSRLKSVTVADLQKEFDLSLKIRDSNNELHTAVNQIRELRSDLETLKKWAGDTPQAKQVIAAADALDKKMTPIEEQLIQVKMKSSEGNLRYPNELNQALAILTSTVEYADAAPTQPQIEVYDLLNTRLQAQLKALHEVFSHDLPALNELMHKTGVPALTVPSGTPAGS
jgi:hypothetical protein